MFKYANNKKGCTRLINVKCSVSMPHWIINISIDTTNTDIGLDDNYSRYMTGKKTSGIIHYFNLYHSR